MHMCGQGLLNNKQSAQALTNQRREYFQPAVPFHVSSCHIPNPFLPMQQLPEDRGKEIIEHQYNKAVW